MKKKETIAFFSEGTRPLDGGDPLIYSKVVPFHPFSFLRLNSANTIPESEKQYLPNTLPPTYLNEQELYSRQFTQKDDILKDSSMIIDKESGGVKMVDQEILKTQRSLFAELITKLGKSAFNSNMIGFSLPIRLMEPRSDLDRLAEFFRMFGYFLSKAANSSDKLERLKLVTTATIAVTYLMLRKQKSFKMKNNATHC